MNKNINKLDTAQKNNLKNETYWQKFLNRIIAIEKDQMVFQNLGKEVKIPLRSGTKEYTVRRYLHLPVDVTKSLLAEGVAPESLKMEGVRVSGEASQYGNYIELTDVVNDIHFDDLKKEYTPELARHAVELKERIVLKAFAEASEAIVGGHTAETELTATDILTIDELRKVNLGIKVNKRRGHRKGGGSTITVVAPQVMQNLLDDERLLTHVLTPGQTNSPIKNNSLRNFKIYDLMIQESLILADPTTVGENDVYHSYMLGEDPYSIITIGEAKWLESDFKAQSGDPLAQRATFGYKWWYGAKVVDPLAIVKISSVAGDFNIKADKTDNLSRPADQGE